MRSRFVLVAGILLATACQSTPPPDPITLDEIVSLSAGGAESPALLDALDTRPLGFPITFEGMKVLEQRGVPAPVIDVVVASAVQRRARALAPRYSPIYDPWYPWGPWPRWNYGVGAGFHHHYR